MILRKRSAKGLTETLKRIKEQIENGEAIPGEFADLAEIRPEDDREPSDEPEEANAAFDGEVFFPKPSNDEQRRIVDKPGIELDPLAELLIVIRNRALLENMKEQLI